MEAALDAYDIGISMIDLHNKTKIHNIDILDLGLKSYQDSRFSKRNA